MHTVIISKAVEKQILRLPSPVIDRVRDRLAELEENPRPPGVQKLHGRDAWRVRVGDYRIVYEIQDERLVVIVIRVAHRREVYRE